MLVTLDTLQREALRIQKKLYPMFGYTYIFVSERHMAYIIADDKGNIIYTYQPLEDY